MKKIKKAFAMHDDYHVEEISAPLAAEDAATDEAAVSGSPGIAMELSEQMDQVVQGLSGARIGGQVYLVDVRQLEPYPDQPFKQYPLERLQELADDIRRVGVLSPILTRRKKNRLQILAGHNRWQAAMLAGLSSVPSLILDADDDQAVLILTSTNLRQREHLLPSEKAFAYKMQMEALKRQGQKSESGGAYDASSFITQQTGDSRMQIHRYIRLTGLDAGLIELLDKGKISMTPAVSVSYLQPEDQRVVLDCVKDKAVSLTIEKAAKLKELAAGDAVLGEARIIEVLLGTSRKERMPETVSIRYDKIREFLPQNLDTVDIEAWLVEALRGLKERK